MALFDSSSPSNSDAVKLGASVIRAMKALLNTALTNFVNDDGSPKAAAIATAQIQDGAVTSAKLAVSSITGATIADGAITQTKLADGALHGVNSTGSSINSGPLQIGCTYTIGSYGSGDDFTNVGAGSNANGVTFVATGLTPAVWTHGTVLAVSLTVSNVYTFTTFSASDDFSNVGNPDITSGPLTVGVRYVVKSFSSSDDFTNIGGTNSTGAIFEATGTTPTTWTHGSILCLATFTASGATPTTWSHGSVVTWPDSVGLAKMQDKFVTTAKIADEAITTAKIADGAVDTESIANAAVTADKLGDDIPFVSMARWNGTNFISITLAQPTNVSSNTITLATPLPGSFPTLGSGINLVNAPCGILVENTNTTLAFSSGATNVIRGQLYYVYALDSTHILISTSPQGAVDGVTGVVTPAGNFPANSTFKAFNPSDHFKNGCDLVPISSTTNVANIKGFRVVWRVAWSGAISGSVQVAQEGGNPTTADQQQWLRQTGAPSAASADFWYYDGSQSPNIRGDLTATAFQAMNSYNSIVGFSF